ncbi:substrate-binding periplasmic protein [Sneathiella glossodoripedis]|uniref:substrate-binding periplasmic protein n=1 Tax=Sneathiella glossodoripedis TaxID=418853 RepID=UPI00046EA527|nr:ABC transporter substrate-binding protein [Sneathiella glossodoripedis]
MNFQVKFSGLPIVLAFLCGFSALTQAEDLKLNLVTGNDYLPFTDESLPDGGMHTKIVRRVMELEGIPHSITFLPWKRGYELTLSTTYDATFPYSLTKERAKSFVYSDPIYAISNVGFVRENSDLRKSELSEVKGRTLCSPLGYAVPGWLGDAIKKQEVKVLSPVSLKQCFQMLKEGRVDFVHANREQGSLDSAAYTKGMEPFRIMDGSFSDVFNHLIISREHMDVDMIMRRFNRGLKALKDSGEYEMIVQTYRQEFIDKHAVITHKYLKKTSTVQ